MGYTFIIGISRDEALQPHEDVVADLWAQAVTLQLPPGGEGLCFQPADDGLEAMFKPGKQISKTRRILESMAPRLEDALPGVRVRIVDDFEHEIYTTADPPKPHVDAQVFEGGWAGTRDGPHVCKIDLVGSQLQVHFLNPSAPATLLVLLEAPGKESELQKRTVDNEQQHLPVTLDIPSWVRQVELVVEWRGTSKPDQLFQFPVTASTELNDRSERPESELVKVIRRHQRQHPS